MIEIIDKKECCGCWACVSVCPVACISMHSDQEGFAYPKVDKKVCIDCGRCEKVCPVLSRSLSSIPPKGTFAVKGCDLNQRLESSSGGVFSLLSHDVIGRSGVVFGARFNDRWEVVHGYAQTLEEVAEFRGSKYVQSNIGESFGYAKKFLKEGREVLFSGSPCQISGLKNYLGRRYENLVTVDFVCHGVPSPLVLRKYIAEISEGKIEKISKISFRDKRDGWAKFNTIITDSDGHILGRASWGEQDLFLTGFLQNIYLRPSCHACPTRKLSSGSDIVLGDYWGIDSVLKDFDDDRGCSLVIVNSDRGAAVFDAISDRVKYAETDFEPLRRLNSSLFVDVLASRKRTRFFANLEDRPVSNLIENCIIESFADRVWRRFQKYKQKILR